MATFLKIPFFILLAGFLGSIAFVQPAAAQKKEKQKIEIFFTSKMKHSDLMKIKARLLKNNIQMDYNQARYDRNGYLTYLEFSVDCRDGFKGAATASRITEKKQFGFFRDYRNDAPVPFAVGAL